MLPNLDAPIRDDEEEEYGLTVGEYVGLFHGWRCPMCDHVNYVEEDGDPRAAGEIVQCSNLECDWSGRVQSGGF